MKTFPIKDHPTIESIPIDMIRPYLFPSQLEDAVNTGGIKSSLAVAILEDRAFRPMPLAEAAARLKELVDQFNGANTPALAPAAPLVDRLQLCIDHAEAIREGKMLVSRGALNRMIIVMQAAQEALR